MQPGYLPWLGFFELMSDCDLFVFLDDVQYTKRDWRSRNRIRTPQGWQWLSVPVFSRDKRGQLLRDVCINNDSDWRRQHLNALRIHYRKSRHFDSLLPKLERIYSEKWASLLALDVKLISFIAAELSIKTPCMFSSELKIESSGSLRILDICRKLNADELYDSKAAAGFLDRSLFEREGIKVVFQEYVHPVYEQVYKPFVPYMSAVDLLFNCGECAMKILDSGGTDGVLLKGEAYTHV